MRRFLLSCVAISTIVLLSAGLIAAAGSTSPPVSTGPQTLSGFGGIAGGHEFFRQPGSSWKGDITGVGAGPNWSLVVEGIDVTGVTGPADRFIYFNLQDADDGSHFKNLGINVRLDATGAAGGTLFQGYQQWTSEGMSSHGLNAGSPTPGDFDLRLDFTKAQTADAFTYTPYYRLAGETTWTAFFGGPFTATVGGVDWNSGKLIVGFDGGADGVVSFDDFYLTLPAPPAGTLELQKVLLGEGGVSTDTFSGNVTGPDAFDESFADLSGDAGVSVPGVLTGDYTVGEDDPAGIGGGYALAGYALAIEGACPAEPTETTAIDFTATVSAARTTIVCIYNMPLEEETRTVIIEKVIVGDTPPELLTTVAGTISPHGEWSIDAPPGSTAVTGVSTVEHTVTETHPGEDWKVEYALAVSPTANCADVTWSAIPAVVPAGESDYRVCVRNVYTEDETPTPTAEPGTPTVETPTPTLAAEPPPSTVGASTPTPTSAAAIETPTPTITPDAATPPPAVDDVATSTPTNTSGGDDATLPATPQSGTSPLPPSAGSGTIGGGPASAALLWAAVTALITGAAALFTVRPR